VLREIERMNCSAGSCHSLLPGLWPLIRCFRTADGLNTTTRRGETGTLVVFGLRPLRWPFLRFFFRALFPCRPESPILSKCASRPSNATLVHASVYKNVVIQGATVRALRPTRCLCNWISRLEHDDVELNRRPSPTHRAHLCSEFAEAAPHPNPLPRRAGRGRSDRSPLPPQPKLIPLWFGFAASAAAGALAGADADASVYLGSLSARMSILWMAGGLASSSLAFAISAAATLPLR
jgi:hypothetical protein